MSGRARRHRRLLGRPARARASARRRCRRTSPCPCSSSSTAPTTPSDLLAAAARPRTARCACARPRTRRRCSPARVLRRAARLPRARRATATSRCRPRPRCSFSRPSIDVLFETAADALRRPARSASCSPAPTPTAPRAWRAIRRRGGCAIVQDPDDGRARRRCRAPRSRPPSPQRRAALDEIAAAARATLRRGRAVGAHDRRPPRRPARRRPAGEPARARGGARAAAVPAGRRSTSGRGGAARRCSTTSSRSILLDVQMPGMDGFETAELIKRRERTRTIPIIFVTAISKERHHVFRGYAAGAVDYVFKPYDPSVLRSKVAVFLELDAQDARGARAARRCCARRSTARRSAWRAMDLDGRDRRGQPGARDAARLRARRDLRDRHARRRSLHPEDVARRRERARGAAARRGRPLRASRCALRRAPTGGEIPCAAVSFSVARPATAAPRRDARAGPGPARAPAGARPSASSCVREQAARARGRARSPSGCAAMQRITDAALGSLRASTSSSRELLARIDRRARRRHARRSCCYEDGERGHVVFQVAGEAAPTCSERGAPQGGLAARIMRRAPADRRRRRRRRRSSAAHPLGEAVTSLLGVPLLVDGRAIGALHVGTLFPRRFTAEDIDAARSSRPTAPRWRSSARGCFEREHAIAEELQRACCPSSLPSVPGPGDWPRATCRPARARRSAATGTTRSSCPAGALLLVIGDVAGRGIERRGDDGPAAQRAARLRASTAHGPAAVLERLNRFQLGAARDADGDRRAGDASTRRPGELRYANAGHPPPLVVGARRRRRAGSTEARRRAARRARRRRLRRRATATLEPGATLVLYTDGLVEQRGELLDRGLERLERGAGRRGPPSPTRCATRVLHGTLADPDVDDDVTLLVLRMAAVPVPA